MLINSLQNKSVKELNSLKMSKTRKALGRYILEGVKPVVESSNTEQCQEVYFCPELLGKKIALSPAFKGELIEVSLGVYQKITTMENPEGILSVNSFAETNLDMAFISKPFLVFDRIMDPGNMGTLIRSADAFGFRNIVLLDGCTDPYNPKSTRSSMGSVLRVQFARSSEEDFLKVIDSQDNVYLVGLDMNGAGLVDCGGKICGLIIGGESHGLSPVFDQVVNCKFRIAMEQGVESLNAAIAGSIAMHSIKAIR